MKPEDFDILPQDTQLKMNQVFDWFNSNVARLESAYQDIGLKFDKINIELADKNNQLVDLFLENEKIKTQLKSVLESIKSGVIMIDTKEKITIYNSAAELIYGISNKDVLDKNYRDVMHLKKDETSPLIETLNKRVFYTDLEKYWEQGDKTLPIGYSTSLVRDPEGKILGAVEISNDLSQFKQLQNQMQHAQTLVAIGEMAATVAHEIRNPLGAIGGFAGLLDRDLEREDPRRPLVRKIVQGVSSLNKIVSNLLVFSRPMSLNLRKLNFAQWMEDILRYAELEVSQSGKDIDIKRNFNIKDLEVHFDPEKFQQVMLNLTFNAIQCMENKGLLEISLDIKDDNNLIITIKDNGKGIPVDNLEKIFNPFFTTREQGTGLGLAIVKRIIELHGGTITVASKYKEWTKFVIKLMTGGNISYGQHSRN